MVQGRATQLQTWLAFVSLCLIYRFLILLGTWLHSFGGIFMVNVLQC